MNHNVTNISQALAAHAQSNPDATAFVYLEHGEQETRRLSFGQLHAACGGVAQTLRDRMPGGGRALLLYPQGLDFVTAFMGCLYAGIIPAPVSAPEARFLRRSLSRMGQVLMNCDPAIILSTRPMQGAAADAAADLPAFAGRAWLATEDIGPIDSSHAPMPNDGVAYLQYTSGSTSVPKGVEISHANIMHNLAGLNRIEPPREGDCLVSWLPQFHDFGLIYGTLWPVYNGLPAYIMSPGDFVARPARWLEAITRYRGTHSGGANFAYDLCARKVDEPSMARLDLGSWRLAINGAEPIRPSSLRSFTDKFHDVGFRPQTMRPSYGMAESTLLLTTVPSGEIYRTLRVDRAAFEREHQIVPLPGDDATTPATEIVGCGQVVEGHAAAVVNPDSFERCADGLIGEVWLGGGSIAKGYYNNPVATAETFEAHIAGEGYGHWMRSGDYGFFLDGELYITGRRKDLIIIRGANYYPQDIEETAYSASDAFRPGGASAFPIESPDGEQLTVVAEVTDATAAAIESATKEVRTALCEALTHRLREAVLREHGIQAAGVALLPPRALPKTTSGKIQRAPCREALLAGELSVLHCELPGAGVMRVEQSAEASSDIVEWLCRQAASVLGIASARCAPDGPLLDLGLDSLKAMDLAGRIEAAYGPKLELAEIYDAATPRGLAALIEKTASAPAAEEAAPEYEEGTL